MVEINTTTTRPLPRWHVDGTRGSADSPFSLAFDLETWAQVQFSPAPAPVPAAAAAAAPAPASAAAEASDPVLRLPRAGGVLSEVQIWEQFAAAVRGEGEPAVTAESVLPT